MSADSIPSALPSLRSKRRTFTALFTATSLAASACGIPVDETQVETLDASGHPELLEGTTSTTLLANPEDEENLDVRLFFIGPDNQLESVIRPVADGTKINAVLGALEQGPLEEEKELFAGDLTTALPSGLSPVLGTRQDGNQPVIVNPEAGLREQIGEEGGRLIVTQIVCTVLDAGKKRGIDSIEIFDGEDEPISLTDSTSQPIVGPATEANFDDCQTGAELELEAEEDAEGAEATEATVATDASESNG